MQISKNIKKTLLLSSLFVLLASKTALAIPFVPSVYVSAGLSNSSVNTYTITDVTNSTKSPAKSSMALNAAIGITPLNVPILNIFRIEAQYFNNFNNSNFGVTQYGATLFTDLKIIPFVNPYIGVGYHTGTIKLNNGLSGIDENLVKLVSYNKSATNNAVSVHAGATAKIPFLGFGVFAEYKLLLSKFNVKVNIPANNQVAIPSTVKYGALNHNIVFGIKYFIL